MKNAGIFVAGRRKSPKQMLKCTRTAQGPIRELLIALIEEDTWSKNFAVRAYFPASSPPFLTIRHSSFPLDHHRFVTITDNGTWLTVSQVEIAIREHILAATNALPQEINRRRSGLLGTLAGIGASKARAAILPLYPEALDCEEVSVPKKYDLFAFCADGQAPIFVTRRIDYDFTGGVVRLNISPKMWQDLPEDQRRNLFWEQLARQHASLVLDTPEYEFVVKEIHSAPCQGHITRVLFELRNPVGAIAVIEFDNQIPVHTTRLERSTCVS